MAAWRLAAGAAVLLVWAGGAGAQDASVVSSRPEPTPLEWLRYVRPVIGRDVVVPATNGSLVRTIEWRHPVEVRVRTESGAALTGAEQAAVRDLALVCGRGTPRDVSTRTEFNGTFVVDYGCVWLQGYEG